MTASSAWGGLEPTGSAQNDITCNGYEIASGGIRNHWPGAMVKAFEIAG